VGDFIVCKDLRRPRGASAGLGAGVLLKEDRIFQELSQAIDSSQPLAGGEEIIFEPEECSEAFSHSGRPKILQTMTHESVR